MNFSLTVRIFLCLVLELLDIISLYFDLRNCKILPFTPKFIIHLYIFCYGLGSNFIFLTMDSRLCYVLGSSFSACSQFPIIAVTLTTNLVAQTQLMYYFTVTEVRSLKWLLWASIKVLVRPHSFCRLQGRICSLAFSATRSSPYSKLTIVSPQPVALLPPSFPSVEILQGKMLLNLQSPFYRVTYFQILGIRKCMSLGWGHYSASVMGDGTCITHHFNISRSLFLHSGFHCSVSYLCPRTTLTTLPMIQLYNESLYVTGIALSSFCL